MGCEEYGETYGEDCELAPNWVLESCPYTCNQCPEIDSVGFTQNTRCSSTFSESLLGFPLEWFYQFGNCYDFCVGTARLLQTDGCCGFNPYAPVEMSEGVGGDTTPFCFFDPSTTALESENDDTSWAQIVRWSDCESLLTDEHIISCLQESITSLHGDLKEVEAELIQRSHCHSLEDKLQDMSTFCN